MKYLENVTPVFQGDVGFFAIDEIPYTAKKVVIQKEIIVAHSETGHHHVIDVMDRDDVEFYQDLNDSVTAYLNVIRDDVKVEHLRSFDTHAPVTITPGKYVVRRQRENAPEGWRVVND